MTRVQQAIQKVKDAYIANDPRFADKDFRVRWWSRLGAIQQGLVMSQMTEIALQDLEHPYPLEEVETSDSE